MARVAKQSTEEKTTTDVVKEIDDLEAWSDKPEPLLAQRLTDYFTRLEGFLGRLK